MLSEPSTNNISSSQSTITPESIITTPDSDLQQNERTANALAQSNANLIAEADRLIAPPASSDELEKNPLKDFVLVTNMPLQPGRLRVTVLCVQCSQPLKRPYIVLRLGDQEYRTAAATLPPHEQNAGLQPFVKPAALLTRHPSFLDRLLKSNPLPLHNSTSTSGHWHEAFEFRVSFHAQLFWSLQLDLYDASSFIRDKHLGRAEMRLAHLEGLPETFTSWYEIWDKRLAQSATTDLKKRLVYSQNRGAVQIQIGYRFQTLAPEKSLPVESEQKERRERWARLKGGRDSGDVSPATSTSSLSLLDVTASRLMLQASSRVNLKSANEEEQPRTATDVPSSEEPSTSLLERAESLMHVEQHRLNRLIKEFGSKFNLEHVNSQDAGDGHAVDDVDGNIDNDDMIMEDILDAPNVEKNEEAAELAEAVKAAAADDQELTDLSILDLLGGYVISEETLTVLKAVQRISIAYGQGLEISNTSFIVGMLVLENFYLSFPRHQTGDLVQSLQFLENPKHFYRFAMSAYGWKGLNFFGKGNGYVADSMRTRSDERSVLEFLAIPKPDLLNFELTSDQVFRPSYFIALDRHSQSIVLSIRGTMSTTDALTDLICEYAPFKGGLVHSGILASATWFIENTLDQLISFVQLYDARQLIVTGHSLGASTAAALTILLQDHLPAFKGKSLSFRIHCYAYAPPCVVDLALSRKYAYCIDSFVYGDDIVCRLSYGAAMDFRTMILCAVENCSNHFTELYRIISGKAPVSESSKRLMNALKTCRESIARNEASQSYPKLYLPGTIYHMYVQPRPNQPKYTVMERSDPELFCEIAVRRTMLMDHIPNKYDRGLERAYEALLQWNGPETNP